MRWLFRMIRSVVVLFIVIAIIMVIWIKGHFDGWNVFDNTPVETKQVANGVSYTMEDNALLKNIPLNQVKNVFNFMDKKEFMAVTGLSRMGFNQEYIIGQRGSEYIMYPFGSNQLFVFNSEAELMNELTQLNQNIVMQESSAY